MRNTPVEKQKHHQVLILCNDFFLCGQTACRGRLTYSAASVCAVDLNTDVIPLYSHSSSDMLTLLDFAVHGR